MTSLGLGDVAPLPVRRPARRAPGRRRRPAARGARRVRDRRQRARPAPWPRAPAHGIRAARWPGCRSTRGWAGWSSRPSGSAASARCSSSSRPCRSRTRASGRSTSRPRPTSRTRGSRTSASDFVTWLNLWRYLKEQQHELSHSAFRRMCKAEYLNYLRIREWQDLHSQLRAACRSVRIDPDVATSAPRRRARLGHHPPGAARRAAVARRRPRPGQARVPRGPRRAVRHLPRVGAVPQAARLGDGRRAGRDQPALGPGQRRDRARVGRGGRRPPGRSARYSEPHWSRKAGARRRHRAGHPLRRAAGHRPHDPVRPDRPRGGPRALHPARPRRGRLGAAARLLEAQRRHCSPRSPSSRSGPGGATSSSTTRCSSRSTTPASRPTWSPSGTSTGGGAASGGAAPTCSPSPRTTSPREAGEQVSAADYPRTWRQGDLDLDVTYQFSPGEAADGVTVHVPVAVLNRVTSDGFDWQVPGLRDDLAIALLQVAAQGDPPPLRARPPTTPWPPSPRPTRRAAPLADGAGPGAPRAHRHPHPAGGVGPVARARPPAGHLQRRRPRRAGRGPRQGPRRPARRRPAARCGPGWRGPGPRWSAPA